LRNPVDKGVSTMDFRTLLSAALRCGPGAVPEHLVGSCQAVYLAWVEIRNRQNDAARPHELTDSEAALIAALVAATGGAP
jgi:bifunctional pyridoxal-dependent enzyme with beta-cystathionase and maltose regulon repressor activities